MQTTLSPTSLRTFTKGITCIARYGDELCLEATSEQLTLCATNSAKSAYCGINFLPEFFDSYRVGAPPDAWGMTPEGGESYTVRGQLLVKTLLSILRHKTVEKTLDKCEFSVVEGVQGGAREGEERAEDQSAESRLVIRMHCKFGVIKTHKLYLNQPPVVLKPTLPDQRASRVTVGPRAMRDLLDHFGRRADSQLQWMFSDTEVRVRSLERDAENQGKHQLATEISVPAEEFDYYEVMYAPVGLAFHLREINASIALAESLSLPLELSFTEPGAPMIIALELDAADHLAMVATSASLGFGAEHDEAIAAAAAKRQREDDGGALSSAGSARVGSSAKRRTTKVVGVARATRTDSHTSKALWSATPSVNGTGPGPSNSRGGTQRMQGTPSFAVPQSTPNQADGGPSFVLDEKHQSTPRPPKSPSQQPMNPQGTPSFVLPPNAQSTQRPPSPPSFNAPQSTLQQRHPRFQFPTQPTQQQPPGSSQFVKIPSPPRRPLFLPSSQPQFTQGDWEVLKEAGLDDLEHMTQKELDDLLGDEDEVPGTPGQEDQNMDELEVLFNQTDFDESQVVGTQGASVARLGDKASRPSVKATAYTNGIILDVQALVRGRLKLENKFGSHGLVK